MGVVAEHLKKKLTESVRSGEDYWKDPETLKMLLSAVPNYHLSKFQPYLPEELKLRLVADKRHRGSN